MLKFGIALWQKLGLYPKFRGVQTPKSVMVAPTQQCCLNKPWLAVSTLQSMN